MKQFFFAISVCCGVFSLFITVLAIVSNRVSGSIILELLSHFQMQYFVMTLVLSAIAITSHITHRFNNSGRPATSRKVSSLRLALVPLFCSALLSAQIAPWYLPSAFASTPTNYRVMSTNLNIRNRDASEILKLTEKEQPDLALFIEVNDDMAEQLKALNTSFPYSSNQLTPYQPDAVLYSKYPLSDFEIRKFDTNNAVNLTAHVQVKQQTLSIVAIHPLPPLNQSFLESRNRVFRAASEYVQQQRDPVLLIGDFNVTMWSPDYRRLVRETGLKNTRKGVGTLPTWPANMAYLSPKLNLLAPLLQIPIDQCLADRSLKVTGMHTGPDVGSDHLPIVIDFAVSQL